MSPFGIVVPLDIETQRALAVIFCSLRFLGNCDSGGRRDALRVMIVSMLDVDIIHNLCFEEEGNMAKAEADAHRIFAHRDDDELILDVMETLDDEIDGEGNRMRFAYRLNRAMVLGYEELEGVMGNLGAVAGLAN
ncbi:hypothetical protein H1R20_g688, partial [Candolleomyces eurysporus]